jgi:hypothetical protein
MLTRTPIAPHQVTSNADGKLLQIERIAADYTIPTPQRMAQITALCDDYRRAVEGSTADPFRTRTAL